MVVMQLLFDSLSRCFGLPLHPDDNHDHNHKRNRHRNQSSRNTKPPLGSQPLGVSKSRTRSNDHLKDLSHDEQLEQHNNNNDNSNYSNDTGTTSNRRKESNNSLKLHDAEWDNLFDTVSHHQQSSACCFSPTANPIHEHDVTEFPLLEPSPGRTKSSFCNVSLSRPKRHMSRNSSTSSSKDVLLRKARKEINKRKLDIFRSDPSSKHPYQQPFKRSTTSHSSSFASRILLGGSSTESPSALLCFANPIFDSDDDDMRLYREGNDRDGEDTITSTLFFESKYEHVVENGPPVPLYYDQALKLDEENDDEIVKLYENGCIKHEIKSIFCHTNNSQRNGNNENNGAGIAPPPPPPQEQLKPGPKSMADSTSSNEDLDDLLFDSDLDEDFIQKITRENCGIVDNNHKPRWSDLTSTPQHHNHHHHDHQQQQHHKIQLYKSDDGFPSTQPTNTMSTIPSPPNISKSRQELNVISDLVFDKSVGTGRAVGASIRLCSRGGGNGGSTSPTSPPPMLKLMNYSSLSSGTQALTPVNSASTGHLSPKKEDCTYVDPFDGEGNMEAMVEKI